MQKRRAPSLQVFRADLLMVGDQIPDRGEEPDKEIQNHVDNKIPAARSAYIHSTYQISVLNVPGPNHKRNLHFHIPALPTLK